MAKGNSGAGGPSLGGGSGKSLNIKNETDVWTYRHGSGNEPFVDEINTGVAKIQRDFPDVMNSVEHVNAAELGGADKKTVLGFYGQGRVSINQEFTDVGKMNDVYDISVKQGYHPSRGNLTGTQAVALHEMGHALNDHIGQKNGMGNIDASAKTIVDNAYKKAGGKGGTKAWAGTISRYAQESNAECIAEAVADYYCNGSKASAASKAIMAELKSYK